MPKRPRRLPKQEDPVPESPKATQWLSYSVRLTDRERALVFEAARIKNWTATSLIKHSAVERAAHIVNTTRPNTFKFADRARVLAKLLSKPEPVVSFADEHPGSPGSPVGEFFNDFFDSHPEASPTIWPRPADLEQLREIRRAVELGGTEFVMQILVECERLLTEDRPDLPAPIDPANL